MEVYHESATSTDTPPFLGSLALTSAAVRALPLAAARILDVLHSVLAVGELGLISQAEIAARGGISEGTVSRTMPLLEQKGFFTRARDASVNSGRGGYLITLLPLPDESGDSHPQLIGSIADPITDDGRSPTEQRQTTLPPLAPGRDQLLIGRAPNMDDHDSQTQQQPRARVFVGADTAAARRDLGGPDRVWPRQWQRIVAANPGYTRADFDRELAVAAARPDVHNPISFVAGLRAGGESVTRLEDLHARSAASTATRSERGGAATEKDRRHHPRYAGGKRATEQYTPPSDAEIADTKARFAAAPYLNIDIKLPDLRVYGHLCHKPGTNT